MSILEDENDFGLRVNIRGDDDVDGKDQQVLGWGTIKVDWARFEKLCTASETQAGNCAYADGAKRI